MGKIDCEIIMDLLPNYVEKLTSERTNQAVEEHLKTCDQCREACERMMEELEPSEKDKIPEPVRVLPFLEKMKSRFFFRGAVLAAVICLALWGITEAYRYVKYAVPVSAEAVSSECYLLADGSIFVDIQAAEDSPVTHGWSLDDRGEPFMVGAMTDRVPLDWLYWIEDHLPFGGTEGDRNRVVLLLSAAEAENTTLLFLGRTDEGPVVLYDPDTELLPGTKDQENMVETGTVYHHMVITN